MIKQAALLGGTLYIGVNLGAKLKATNENTSNNVSTAVAAIRLNVMPQKALRDTENDSISRITKYGCPQGEKIMRFSNFIVSYDQRNRIANWVLEHINSEDVEHRKVDRSKCIFQPDPLLHPYYRAQNEDYKGSGYERGHLVAAGNHKKEKSHYYETFFLSNVTPQVGDGFNRGAWNRLERYVRNLAKQNANLYICTGPLFLPREAADGKFYVNYEVIGVRSIAVPTHFFKVIVIETHAGKIMVEAFVMPNRKIDNTVPLAAFYTSIEAVERASGLLFFSNTKKDAASGEFQIH